MQRKAGRDGTDRTEAEQRHGTVVRYRRVLHGLRPGGGGIHAGGRRNAGSTVRAFGSTVFS